MHQKDVLNKCRELGHPVTAQALYFSGKKYGFLTKEEGKHSWNFDKEKFLKWIEDATREIPEGYMSIKDFAKSKGKSLTTIYSIIKDDENSYMRIGAGKGVIYVNKETVEELIRKREELHKEKW